MATTFFSIGQINELVLQGHSYISNIGVKIIDDKNCKGSTILEGHFYNFLDLLEIIEERKDLETTDDNLQNLVLRLYGFVQNECIYYNSLYLDIDGGIFTGSITVSTAGAITQAQLQAALTSQKTLLDITNNATPLVINWKTDIVPTIGDGRTYAAKHGNIGYVFSAKWKNGTQYEKNDGYTIQDLYDSNGLLQTVTINVFDTPFRFIIL